MSFPHERTAGNIYSDTDKMPGVHLQQWQRFALTVEVLMRHRTILDIQETGGDFWRFFQQHWGPLVASKQTRIGLFNSQGYKLRRASL